MSITVPPRIRALLAEDGSLSGSIARTLDAFSPWLKASGMPFFPEYTAHDEDHITGVLSSASSLIADEAWKQLTPADAGTLIIASLLHDCGMHLTEDGFRFLVTRATDQYPRIDGFADRPWSTLWADFLAEASRFDGRKLTAIFGDPTPIDPRRVDIHDLKERDRLLVGEFIRRHHARLAHEVAVFGVPGPSTSRLSLEIEDNDLADIAGLVARSHGLAIRDTFEYLRNKYDIREYRGIHAVYLMAVIRIADYLQVQSERAPQELLKVKAIRSPTSEKEWGAHAAIRDVRGNHEDPEALFIDALPKDVATYLKLRRLFADIQHELDGAWATIGEIYGRFALRSLGLTIRRIRSSLDDPNQFRRKVDYLPMEASFEAAGTDLLKLLVGPLYGDAVPIGVRELIQNAVDACLELQDWCEHHGVPMPQTYDQPSDVLVKIIEDADKTRWVEVTDRGIGMTAEVVRHYFLRAGASFRYSEAWRKEHEDEGGKPRVIRGGRFGVGALAAFLLGPKIQVTTRHISEPPDAAIAFEATLESETIELRQTGAPVGTRIRISIDDEDTWRELAPLPYQESEARDGVVSEWDAVDWYCLQKPSVTVQCVKPSRVFTLGPQYRMPGSGASLTGEWVRIASDEYDDVQWSYEEGPHVACNGIIIPDGFGRHGHGYMPDLWKCADGSFITFRRPSISVFDAKGVFPLNLQRTFVTTDQLPFDLALVDSVAEDFLAYCFAFGPNDPSAAQAGGHFVKIARYPALEENRFGDTAVVPVMATRRGIGFLDGPLLEDLALTRVWCVSEPGSCPMPLMQNLGKDAAVCFGNIGDSPNPGKWVRLAFGGGQHRPAGGLRLATVAGSRTMLTKKQLEFATAPRRVRRDIVAQMKVEWEHGDYCVLRSGASPDGGEDGVQRFLASAGWDGNRPEYNLIEWELGTPTWAPLWPTRPGEAAAEPRTRPLVEPWRKYLPGFVIPYDVRERERVAAGLPEQIQRRIAYHKERLQAWRERREESVDDEGSDDTVT